MWLRRLAVLFLLIIGLGVLMHPAQAQTSDPACPALVELALSQVGNNCGDLGRNSACYGFNRLSAAFNQAVDVDLFTRPSDRTELALLKSIQTAPLDLGLGQWGIAVMNVQANVPDTLPGQAVTFLLLGDSEIENAVQTSAESVQSVTVILQAATDLRGGAQATSAIIGKLAAGTVVDADAISDDGSAIRLNVEGAGGWVNRDAVNANPTLDNLPKVKPNSDSPMQSFYFRTRPGSNLSCAQTPSVLAIQSPQHLKVNLTANGADIELGSLVTLQVLPDGKTMQITTLDGEAIVNKGKPDEVRIPAGSTSSHCLSEPQDLGIDNQANDQTLGTDCQWDQPRSATVIELEQGQTAQAILDRLGLTPLQPIITPEPTTESVTPVPTPTSVPPPTECPMGTNIRHVVVAGENLYRISVRYKTSMGAIMAANGITNAERIFTGQNLIIPCGVDTGIPSLPQIPSGPPIVPTGVDCRPFRATSPLDGLNYGSNTFYWDGAVGVTSYRVNIYGIDEAGGRLVRSFDSRGTVTNLTADITVQTTGYGFKFAWDVQALLNGVVVCNSARATVPRGAPPDSGSPVVSAPPGFTATWGCSGAFTFKVDFSGAPAGTTSVVVNYSVLSGGVPAGPMTGSVPPDPGSVVFIGTSTGTITGGSITANPSSTTLALPGTLTC